MSYGNFQLELYFMLIDIPAEVGTEISDTLCLLAAKRIPIITLFGSCVGHGSSPGQVQLKRGGYAVFDVMPNF